jgi:hypothetical protein
MGTSYAASVFRATHNSYSGGGRGSLLKQLEGGVRLIELDVINTSYRRYGYRLGHGIAGLEVAKGNGNPDELGLKRWLEAVTSWCSDNPDHSPVTVLLDPKGDLTAPDSFEDGNLAALNGLVDDVFGDRLYRAHTLAYDSAWPSVTDLGGKVICVLSGNIASRRGYVSDGGREPAVALDDRGRVVEVHSSGHGHVWYWSGQRSGDGVTWRRHGRIGAGRSPAVTIAGDGTIVAVHGGGGADLSYRLGTFQDDALEVRWGAARKAAPAAAGQPSPTVLMLDARRLRITYETEHGRLAREGTLGDNAVDWDSEDAAPASPADAAWSASHARNGSAEVTVVAVPHPHGDETRLLYGTEALDEAPIAYEQLLFVEGQWVPDDGENDIAHGRRFVATAASPSAAKQTKGWQDRGKVVRLWGFGEADARSRAAPNFPATDQPDADWYRAFCEKHSAV